MNEIEKEKKLKILKEEKKTLDEEEIIKLKEIEERKEELKKKCNELINIQLSKDDKISCINYISLHNEKK